MKQPILQKGFTMIEMIVVLGIFAVMSGIVLFNYSKFRSDTILTNMAYEIALSIREAQIYGVSVRSPNGGTPDFSEAYGIYFSGEESNQYLLFADDDGSLEYEGSSCTDSGADTCVTPYTLLGNIKIVDVAILNNGGNCPMDDQPLSILFKRPNPEPVINSDNSISQAQITVTSEDAVRYVVISNNGQVSVLNDSICN